MRLSKLSENDKTLLFLSLITLLGFFLRLYRIGAPSLWFDEIMTAGRIDCPLAETLKGLPASGFPPLYYTLMNAWVKIFGISEISLRFPSLIFSTSTIPLIFKLSAKLFDKKAGIFAALLLSVSPFAINYAQEAKMYSMLWFFGMLSFYFFYKYSEDGKTRNLLLYAASATLSIHTLYMGFLFIIVQNMLSFAFLDKRQLKKWWLGQLLIFLLFFPCLKIFIFKGFHYNSLFWIPRVKNHVKVMWDAFETIAGTFLMHPSSLKYALNLLYCILLFSAFISFKNSRHKKNIYLLIAWLVIPVIVYYLIDRFNRPIFCVRYLSLIYAPLIILFGKGLDRYKVGIKYALLVFILATISITQLYPYYKYNLKINGENWRTLFHELSKNAPVDSLIVISANNNNLEKFCRGAKYYNEGRPLDPTPYNKIKKEAIEDKYGSIFVIYRQVNKNNIKNKMKLLKGYKFKKDRAFRDSMGYLWFEKSKAKLISTKLHAVSLY